MNRKVINFLYWNNCILVLILKEKNYFGELEILTNSATRSVTAIADTECKLLGLEIK